MRILPVNNYNYQSKIKNNQKQNVNFGTNPSGKMEVLLKDKAKSKEILKIVRQRILDIEKAVADNILPQEKAQSRLENLRTQEAQISRGLESADK